MKGVGAFGLNKAAAARAQAQHEEWVATADYRAAQRQIERDEGRYNAGVRAAKSLVGTEGGKESSFLMSCTQIWRGVERGLRQVEQQELELENARAKADANTCGGLMRRLQGLALTRTTIAKSAPPPALASTANNMVTSFLENMYKTQDPPTAAMLGLFEGAALDYVTKNGIGLVTGT